MIVFIKTESQKSITIEYKQPPKIRKHSKKKFQNVRKDTVRILQEAVEPRK